MLYSSREISMSFPLMINSTHYVTNNTYKVNLPTTLDLDKFGCSMGSGYVYNSWYNINATPLNNNTFQLTIPTSGASVVKTIVLPDGAYNISTLNSYLQYYLIQNGYYITNNTTGLNTYYASFQLSPSAYGVQFIATAMPTSLPAGYTSGGMTFPSSANQSYQLTVLSTNNFYKIIGFSAGTYPSVPTISALGYTYLSNLIPNVQPINAIQMRLSCLYNPFSSNSQLLHIFNTKGTAVGESIDISPVQLQFVPCRGMHSSLTLQFFDQNGQPLNMLDPNITVKLIFTRLLE